MKNSIFLLVLLLYVNGLFENSDEFYECLNPDKIVKSPSECTSIKINETEGYKCCSMKITYNGNSSYNCFAIEIEYTKNKTIFDEYIANNSIASIYSATGGQMEIDCGEKLTVKQDYEKVSDEYLDCYTSHISGVQNANDCHKYIIPEKDKSNCCYLENIKLVNNSNIIIDKRCYIIQDKYLTKEKNLNDYLLDNSNVESLDEIKNTNITINCKNYDIFYFTSKFDTTIQPKDEAQNNNNNNNNSNNLTNSTDNNDAINDIPIKEKKKDSGISTGAIVGIVIAGAVVLIGIAILSVYCLKKRKLTKNEINSVKEGSVEGINNFSKSNA